MMSDPDPTISSELAHDETIAQWKRKLAELSVNEYQSLAIDNFFESFHRLIVKRSEIHQAAVQFHHAQYLNTTTMDIQFDYYFRVESFFQGFYSTLSHLANATHKFVIFRDIPVSKNSRFLKAIGKRYTHIASEINLLEEAREHRAFIDHPGSNSVVNWLTVSSGDERILNVIYYGDKSGKGTIPVNAVEGKLPMMDTEWYKSTPNYFDIERALMKLVDEIIGDLSILAKELKGG